MLQEKNVLSLYQENIFSAPEIISVRVGINKQASLNTVKQLREVLILKSWLLKVQDSSGIRSSGINA